MSMGMSSDSMMQVRQGAEPRTGDSMAAELALVALLADPVTRQIVKHLYLQRRPQSTDADHGIKLQSQFAPMRELWNSKYNAPLDDGSDGYRYPEPRLVYRPEGFEGKSSTGMKHDAMHQGEGYPVVGLTRRGTVATMAHEMGHADMAGPDYRGRLALTSDPLAYLQQGQLGGVRPVALSRGGRGWQALLPYAPMVIGAGAGMLGGETQGALAGAAAGLLGQAPLLAVEAEAWRRGAQYAATAGLGRKEYYRKAVLPFLGYLVNAAGKTAAAAGAGGLAGWLGEQAQG